MASKLMKFNDILKRGKLFDSHSHISISVFDKDRDGVVERAMQSGVENIIDVSTDISSSIKSLEVTKQYNNIVYSAVGIHPEIFIPGSDLFNEAFDVEAEIEKLKDLISQNLQHIAMLGETGLDYYWLSRGESSKSKIQNSKLKQQELFIRHIKLANEYNLPLTIHSRSAVSDCIHLVAEYNGRGVFHSLTNDSDDENDFYHQINVILEMGCLIGINGIITYNSAELIQRVLRKVFKERFKDRTLNPLKDRLEPRDLYEVGFVLETDSPFLSPTNYQPIEKRRNEPAAIEKLFKYLGKSFSSD